MSSAAGRTRPDSMYGRAFRFVRPQAKADDKKKQPGAKNKTGKNISKHKNGRRSKGKTTQPDPNSNDDDDQDKSSDDNKVEGSDADQGGASKDDRDEVPILPRLRARVEKAPKHVVALPKPAGKKNTKARKGRQDITVDETPFPPTPSLYPPRVDSWRMNGTPSNHRPQGSSRRRKQVRKPVVPRKKAATAAKQNKEPTVNTHSAPESSPSEDPSSESSDSEERSSDYRPSQSPVAKRPACPKLRPIGPTSTRPVTNKRKITKPRIAKPGKSIAEPQFPPPLSELPPGQRSRRMSAGPPVPDYRDEPKERARPTRLDGPASGREIYRSSVRARIESELNRVVCAGPNTDAQVRHGEELTSPNVKKNIRPPPLAKDKVQTWLTEGAEPDRDVAFPAGSEITPSPPRRQARPPVRGLLAFRGQMATAPESHINNKRKHGSGDDDAQSKTDVEPARKRVSSVHDLRARGHSQHDAIIIDDEDEPSKATPALPNIITPGSHSTTAAPLPAEVSAPIGESIHPRRAEMRRRFSDLFNSTTASLPAEVPAPIRESIHPRRAEMRRRFSDLFNSTMGPRTIRPPGIIQAVETTANRANTSAKRNNIPHAAASFPNARPFPGYHIVEPGPAAPPQPEENATPPARANREPTRGRLPEWYWL